MIVWLASYPRSGNTFFRVVLNSVFNIKTYSIYDDGRDIGADEATSDIVGHAFLPKDFDLEKARASKETYYIKTHELLENMILDDKDKVIYLIRDGRESTLSFTKYLKNYHGKSDDLTDVLYGNTPFKSWGEHVRQWSQLDDYLLIKFEELTEDPTSQLQKIADYLDIRPSNEKIPTFQELQQVNPKFFRSGKNSSWKEHFTKIEHLAFWLRNYEHMIAFGYTNDMPKEVSESSFKTYLSLFDAEINALENHLFADTLMKQKIRTLEEKLNNQTKKIDTLKSAIQHLITTKVSKSPFKKYQNYKAMLKAYNEI